MCTIDQQSVMGVEAVASGTTIVDTKGFEALTFALQVANGTTVAFTDGNDSALSDGSAVEARFLIGPTSFTQAGSALIGYVGKNRYVKVTVTNEVADTSLFALSGARDRNGQFQDVDKSN